MMLQTMGFKIFKNFVRKQNKIINYKIQIRCGKISKILKNYQNIQN